ncbi:helix-turn-helix domain-containing protein [Shinella pollutisoli]|uniref:Helix-turn-helix domain-containing protein n=1 Tax=Shinella pollutisoli TaxID=2250594 RepID=A0ABV7DKJ2_9HYPH|nr:helix-turn-helix domain-containing protein [Shinella pollutisoli]
MSATNHTHDRDLVEAQQREIDVLRERLRQALEALAPSAFSAPAGWGLCATEARIFAHLQTKPLVTKASLMVAAYGHWIDEMPAPNTLESHISKLRRKIRRFGYAINNERGMGYRLIDPAGDVGHV